MRRALLVSYYFPPRFSVGGKRAHRFARYLPDHGWSAAVLTAPAPASERLDDSYDAELPGCDVQRTYLTEDEVARIPKREFGSDGTIDKPTPTWSPLAMKRGLDRLRGELRYVPIIGPDVGRLPALALRIARAAERSRAEVIFATGAPWDTVVAGVLAARSLGLPVVVDFRDPWSFGPVTAARPAWVRAADTLAERAVLRAADVLTVTSETTRDAYIARGAPARVHCIRNSFDPALHVAPRRDDRFTLIHFGNCYCGRTLEPFLRALAAVTSRRKLGPSAVRLLNLGRVAEEDVRLAAGLDISAMFEHQTVLPYAEGLALVAGADLALLQGYGEDPWFLPAKLYDYLLAGTPILATATSPELGGILARTKVGWALDPGDLAGLEQRIEDALDARASGRSLVQPDTDAVQRMSARATAGELSLIFEDVTRERPRGSVHAVFGPPKAMDGAPGARAEGKATSFFDATRRAL